MYTVSAIFGNRDAFPSYFKVCKDGRDLFAFDFHLKYARFFNSDYSNVLIFDNANSLEAFIDGGIL